MACPISRECSLFLTGYVRLWEEYWSFGWRQRETFSLWNMVYIGSATSAPNSLTSLADVMATKVATFMEKCDMEHVAIDSKDGLVRAESTKLRVSFHHLWEGPNEALQELNCGSVSKCDRMRRCKALTATRWTFNKLTKP